MQKTIFAYHFVNKKKSSFKNSQGQKFTFVVLALKTYKKIVIILTKL